MIKRMESESGRLQAVLEQIGFSEEETLAAEKFFDGQAGEEVLAGFVFQDLMGIPAEPAMKLFKEFIRKKQHDKIRRLFLILFAKGQATCLWQMPEELCSPWKEELRGVDGAKYAAVYAAVLGTGQHSLNMNMNTIELLLSLVGEDPETLKRALSYEKNAYLNGKLVLMALYFFVKYIMGTEKKEQENGAKNHLGKTEDRIPIEEADLPLFAQYEEYEVACLAALYFRNPSSPDYRSNLVYPIGDPKLYYKLMVAVSANGVEEARKQLAGVGIGTSWPILKLAVGLSYINYKLSDRLKNIVRLCAAAAQEWTLDVMQRTAGGTFLSVKEAGEAYEKIFWIDGERYIRWAFEKKYLKILKRQIAENTITYLYVMEKMNLQDANQMLALIKEENPELHRKILEERAEKGEMTEQEKVIAGLVKESVNPELAGNYLRGECGADALYAQNWLDGKKHYYAGGRERDLFDSYQINYDDAEFFRRCKVYMLVSHGGYFFRRDVMRSSKYDEKADEQGVKGIFADFEAEGVPFSGQVFAVSLIYDTLLYEDGQKSFLEEAAKIFAGYLADEKRREELVRAFAGADALGRCFGLKVYRTDVKKNKEEILAYSQDGAKAVKQELFDILCAERDFEAEVKKLLSAKRAAERELAVRVLSAWQSAGEDYRAVFLPMLEKEKNAKVKELLREALEASPEGVTGSVPQVSREELVKELHGGNKKRGLAWAYETPFPVVHKKNGDEAEEKYLQAVLLCYVSQRERLVSQRETLTAKKEISGNAAFLAESLDEGEFAAYVNELFDRWLAAGAEAKRRWVLYAAAVHGGNAIVEKLLRQIKEWPKNARSAIACEAVRALSISPSPQALPAVDELAHKFKSRQVRMAAKEALDSAAAKLGITSGELADRIVPDFGFDENMERYFDYGARGFLVAITPELELEVFEADKEAGGPEEESAKSLQKPRRGKKLKTLPAPGKRDDAKKAAMAYEEFKQMKKQLKTTVTGQKRRLEQAFSTAREWDTGAWRQLFVKNPVMHPFAGRLIWGFYEDGKLVRTFRYMEDGSFNTQDEEEFEFPERGNVTEGEKSAENAKIRLVHPMELSEEAKAAWKQQLADYEIVQPIAQMERQIYTVTEEEGGQQKLMRFYGRITDGAVLNSKLLGFGWYQAMVEDGGCFFAYYREDEEAGFAARIEISGNYVSAVSEEVTVYEIRFYRIGAGGQEVELRSGAEEEKACILRDVPAEYFSEVVWQMTQAVHE